jgi:amino acid adenylation domain-containing protein
MTTDRDDSEYDVFAFEPSFSQERLWFLNQLDPGSPAYNIFNQIRWTAALDALVMERALNEVVRRHEALRTSFAMRDGRPVQVISPSLSLKVGLIDLSGLPAAEREVETARLAAEEAAQPFVLSQGALLRATVVRLGAMDHVVLLTMHHIVSDGWSMGVLFRELGALYEAFSAGRPSPLEELSVQYADFAVWQRERLQGAVLEDLLAYWRERLAGAPAVLALPADRARPAMQSYRGALHTFSLPAELSRRIRALALREGATPFMVLLAGFKALLARLTGQRDIVVGTPIANRTQLELEGLIGFFVNTLALRIKLDGDLSFRDLIARVRETTLAAFAHQDLPFERLVEDLQPQRNLSHHPVFQIMFAMNTFEPLQSTAAASDADDYRETGVGTAKFDFSLMMSEVGGRLRGVIEYATDLFDAATIERAVRCFLQLLEGAVDDPECRLSRLPLLAPDERIAILKLSAGASASRSADEQTVVQLFDRQARTGPDAVALVFGGTTLTYGELAARVGNLARNLVSLGVGPEVRVGIHLQRSPDHVVAVLAVLAAGGCYIPLDPSYPTSRLQFICDSSALSAVIVRSPADAAPFSGVPLVAVDVAPGSSETVPLPSVGDGNLAYVLYTSGSTGVPKGVEMPHRRLMSLIDWERRMYAANPKRVLHLTSLNFDVAAQEIFSTLSSGGVLVIAGENERRDGAALVRYLSDTRIERLYLPFVGLELLANAVAEDDGRHTLFVREIITAGEQLRITDALEELVRRHDIRILRNQYGPTETHVVSDWPLSGNPSGWPRLPPIGRPIDGVHTYILDEHMNLAPLGVPGELYIAGDCLARGYAGHSDWTAERFLPDPYSVMPGARMYRSGDIAQLRPGGEIEFLGRADNQVKIRGYRVEIGEVETVLANHPSVDQAAVWVKIDPVGTRSLVACYTAAAGHMVSEPHVLRAYCRSLLPEYMVPSGFVLVDSLPLTQSGKLDRAQLPVVHEAADLPNRATAAPQTPNEKMLAAIWADILPRGQFGIHDNFFDLGGHSLMATRMVSRIRAEFGLELPLRAVFEQPTVAALAEQIFELQTRRLDASQFETLLAEIEESHH